MDRNTLIGLGLIGTIMVTFTMLNRPSEEDLKKEKAKVEAAKEKKEQKQEEKKKTTGKEEKVAAKEEGKQETADTLKQEEKAIEVAEVKEEWLTLENDKLKLLLSTKGGGISAAYLKEYESYRNFISEEKKKRPLKLFGKGDAKNEIRFMRQGKEVKTSDQAFEVVEQKEGLVRLKWSPEAGKNLIYTYQLKDGNYDLDFSVKQEGFEASSYEFNWEADLYKTERLLSEQRRVSTVCFKYEDEDLDWLSEYSDDDEKQEKSLEWIAFKQSYFSTIIRPEAGFDKAKKGRLKISNFEEDEQKYHSHIKKFRARVGLDLKSGETAKMNWFFGPNDYEVLASYSEGYEDIINYGWGLFRWINIYLIQPMFNFLSSLGLGFGLVILLLTLIVKLFLTPIQWKMYVSSAKMRILKPEIEELNAKYPNKDDAMKKQMEMMSLYRESGASPLAGCIPMLIQMPILLAVFRFFPAAFELRQKGFLWAEDLSSYDSIYDFGMYIWPYGDHVSLFTLLMSGTTLIYTFLNSGNMQQPNQPGMPNMKVLMYIFPVMMIFFFNNFASGLSYYYFISTLISILTMLAIKQFFVDEEKLKAKMAAKKAAAATSTTKGAKKKSKFQERLEQMQKAQQERMKNNRK
ncbi:MAG: membrane protein insertase YidC [Bacteroidetes bacterium]|nr:MAG: membrane protein insertase YidC [Bacteroidota bacterium]